MALGCETIASCIWNRRPEIPDKSFEVGNIGYFYYEDLISEIKNESGDDNYEYYYDVTGNLPNGLEMYSDYRTLSIEGNPEISGSFTFTIHLVVDPPEQYDYDTQEYDDKSMCSTTTSKEFTIIIN